MSAVKPAGPAKGWLPLIRFPALALNVSAFCCRSSKTVVPLLLSVSPLSSLIALRCSAI